VSLNDLKRSAINTMNTNEIICPSCGELCPEDAHFCKSCRSPISSYASTGPFESIFAEGAAYRSAFNEPQKPIVVIGVWLLFAPVALGGLSVLLQSEFRLSDIYMIIVGIGMLLIGSYVPFITTKNYLKSKKEAAQDTSLDC